MYRPKVRTRLDPVQVTQMAKYLETVYVSGWQSSSTASSTNEPGPDLAGKAITFTERLVLIQYLASDYPYNTVPLKVQHLFMAQLFHDRKQREDRQSLSPAERKKTPYVDYLRPIVGSLSSLAFDIRR